MKLLFALALLVGLFAGPSAEAATQAPYAIPIEGALVAACSIATSSFDLGEADLGNPGRRGGTGNVQWVTVNAPLLSVSCNGYVPWTLRQMGPALGTIGAEQNYFCYRGHGTATPKTSNILDGTACAWSISHVGSSPTNSTISGASFSSMLIWHKVSGVKTLPWKGSGAINAAWTMQVDF